MHFPALLGKIAEEESITNQHYLGSHAPEKSNMNFQAWKSPGEKEDMKMSWNNPGNF